MPEFTVDQLKIDQPDSSGVIVEAIYAKVSSKYAVYRTDSRVVVQWADSAILSDDGKTPLGQRQREALSALTPLRGEINGLIDDWRTPSSPIYFWRWWNPSKAKKYDQQVADTLAVALSGDVSGAVDRLKSVRDDILDVRTTLGRVQYVFAALAMGLFAALLSFLVGAYYARLAVCPMSPVCSKMPDWDNGVVQRWAAVGFGALGAFLSVALQIRQRDIKPNLQTSNNLVDAALRICIGALSAMTLVSLLQAGVVTFEIMGRPLTVSDHHFSVLIVASIAAGFTERLVSDAISQATIQRSVGSPPVPPPPVPKGGEGDPGRAATQPPNAAADVAPADGPTAPVPDDDMVDGCLDGVEHADVAPTDDVELPEAIGGVAAADPASQSVSKVADAPDPGGQADDKQGGG